MTVRIKGIFKLDTGMLTGEPHYKYTTSGCENQVALFFRVGDKLVWRGAKPLIVGLYYH